MPAGGQDVLQVLGLLVVHLAEHPLGQDLREAEDRVQGGPELVGHVGEELGLVAAGGLELAALVRDLAEEAGVLDGKGRLGGEGLEQLDDLRRERARRFPVDREPADQLVFAQQRDGEERAVPVPKEDVAAGPAIGILRGDVGDLDRLARHGHAPLDALAFAGRRAPEVQPRPPRQGWWVARRWKVSVASSYS